MRDEMDSRLWADHHEAFSRDLDRGLEKLKLGLIRLWQWDGSVAQAVALVAAFAITALSFTATTA